MKESLLYVKELVATNTVDALNVLNSILKKDVEVFNEFLLYKRQYFENLNLFHNGLIDYENFKLTFNKCTIGLLALIDRINEPDLLAEGLTAKIYSRSKDDRNSRVTTNRIINIDDAVENIKTRTFWKVFIIPFAGILLMLIGFTLLIISNESSEVRSILLPEKPIFMLNHIFLVLILVIFGIAQIWKMYYHRQLNKGEMPREQQQLQIEVKGNYDLIFDSLFRTLAHLKMKITDYQYKNGKIQADYHNIFLIERLFSTFSGEQITIKVTQNEKDDFNSIAIMSTSKSFLSVAHESDFFGLHRSINRKNLQKIQKHLMLNLAKG